MKSEVLRYLVCSEAGADSHSIRTARESLLHVLIVMMLAAVYAGLAAYSEAGHRSYPLDIDGWGFLTQRIKDSGYSFDALFSGSFLKRGPIVPFLFGLCFYFAPFDESILILNVIMFSLAAGCLFLAFRELGSHSVTAYAAIVLWFIYLQPHRYIFGYYFAEPIISLLSAGLFLLVAVSIQRQKIMAAFLSGCVAALLLLVRPPYVFVIGCIPIILWHRLSCQKIACAAFITGLLLLYAPWPIQNYIQFKQLIPFNTDGGIVLFQGTYVAGDDVVYNDLRRMPEFSRIENEGKGKSEIDRNHYWQELAVKQILQDPGGQIYLMVRKAVRFWVYLPQFEWTPSWKTAVGAIIALFFAVIGYLQHRHTLLMQLCGLWIGGLWLFHAIIHSELRYNFSVLPMLLIMSVYGFSRMITLDPRFLRPGSSQKRENLSNRSGTEQM